MRTTEPREPLGAAPGLANGLGPRASEDREGRIAPPTPDQIRRRQARVGGRRWQ